MKQIQRKMTQKEIVVMVLEKLGGYAYLTDICILAKYYIGDSSQAKDVRNNIRRELNSNPDLFCHIVGKPDGWWQLKSYKDEISKLKEQLAEKDAIIDELRSISTEDDFICRLLEKLKNIWANDKKTIGEIRKILDSLGRTDVVEKLDASLEGKDKKPKKHKEKTPPRFVVQGDYVIDKHVGNEVNGVASGATGVNVSKEEK
jgi:hypothetical protein